MQGRSAQAPMVDPIAQTLRQLIDNAGWQPGDFKLDWVRLRSFYSARAFRRAWTMPADEAQVRDLLAHVDREGLSPADYEIEAILPPEDNDPTKLAKYDLLLTNALLNYASDVRTGRVMAAAVESDLDLPPEQYDAVTDLATALAGGALAAYLTALPPTQDDYRALRTLLARYRDIAASGGWPLTPDGGGNGRSARQAQYDRLLVEDANLSAGVSHVGGLGDAMLRFQTHHGLSPDRRFGTKTIEAMNVSVEDRIGQIEANMERWRWMPRTFEARYVAVNAASATLEVHDNATVILSSRVIVGGPETPTPVFRADATALTVNPSWHIPAAIARKEIFPKARRDSNYLSAHHMVLDGNSRTLSQLPGADNSLGVLKLEMANRFDVYLHDTDAHAAFNRLLRDRSHGCVRVELILPLASVALTGNKDDGISALTDDIEAGNTLRIPLPSRLPVYVLYWTAGMNEDGSAQFWPDIYLRDQHLHDALAHRAAGRHPSIL